MIDHNAYSDEYISDILRNVKSIALVAPRITLLDRVGR